MYACHFFSRVFVVSLNSNMRYTGHESSRAWIESRHVRSSNESRSFRVVRWTRHMHAVMLESWLSCPVLNLNSSHQFTHTTVPLTLTASHWNCVKSEGPANGTTAAEDLKMTSVRSSQSHLEASITFLPSRAVVSVPTSRFAVLDTTSCSCSNRKASCIRGAATPRPPAKLSRRVTVRRK